MGTRPTSSEVKRTWPSFLRGEPAEVLSRLSDTDPLRLREGTSKRLREVWFLLEPDRVYERALLVCADATVADDAPEDSTAWAVSKIDLAIEQLVHEDRRAEFDHPEVLSDVDKDFPLLVECLLLDPELVRAASVAFNALEPLPRRAFFELLIVGRDVGEVIENGPWDEDGLYDAVQTALATLNLDLRDDSADDQLQAEDK